MPIPTNKEVIDHLYTKVFLFDEEDIASCETAGLKYYRKLKSLTYDDLETLRKENKISMPVWRSLTDYQMYAEATKPSMSAIMLMTEASWEAVDFSLLRLNHKFTKTSIALAKPEITADTVTSTQIDTIPFLKYCDITLLDKSNILHFYDNLLIQAKGYKIFLRPSEEITPTEGVIPDGLSTECKNITATALHSKLSQANSIAASYVDAKNLLATTTDGYEFLQLLMNQQHPLLVVKNIATVDIPKYSTYKSLFRYAREIKQYVKNHKIKNRIYTEMEITQIFLSHLDDPQYASAVKDIEAALLLSTTVGSTYLVPAIAGTIDQLVPSASTGALPTKQINRIRNNDQINAMLDYYYDDSSPNLDAYCHEVDVTGESPFCRSFRDGGGRTPFSRGSGRGRQRKDRFSGRQGRGNRNYKQKAFKGKCNCCGMDNHHANSCHFLMKLRQALTYMGVDPEAAFKKKVHFQSRHTYDKNRSFVRSLMDAGFIPFTGADEDNFIDVVDGDFSVFSPDIINSVEDDTEEDIDADAE